MGRWVGRNIGREGKGEEGGNKKGGREGFILVSRL